MKLRVAALAALMAMVGAVDAQDFGARARALHKQTPLIDGHNDYPWALRGLDPGRDFSKADISKPVPSLMTDIPRLRQGGVGGQFWSVYVPSTMKDKEAVRATLEQIDIVHRMTRRWPETFEMAHTAADVERAFKAGAHRLADRHGGRPLDRQLAGDAAHDVRAGRALHDADPLRATCAGPMPAPARRCSAACRSSARKWCAR